MTVTIPDGAQPVLPQPEKSPAAIHSAVAALNPAWLPEFEQDWAAAMAKGRDEYSLMPPRLVLEKWWMRVAVRRWPALRAQLEDCERRSKGASTLEEAHAISTEIGQILQVAADAGAQG
jgi:hypothetical protein